MTGDGEMKGEYPVPVITQWCTKFLEQEQSQLGEALIEPTNLVTILPPLAGAAYGGAGKPGE